MEVETQALFLPSHSTTASCKQDAEQTEIFHPRPFGRLEGGWWAMESERKQGRCRWSCSTRGLDAGRSEREEQRTDE